MTVFILVPGVFTGAQVWEETAARLAKAGDEVHTVDLTGLAGAGAAAPTDVERPVDRETIWRHTSPMCSR